MKTKFRITTSLTPSGSIHWEVHYWDQAVAAALGDEQGWVRIGLQGNAETRVEAHQMARDAADGYLWRLNHADVQHIEIELENE